MTRSPVVRATQEPAQPIAEPTRSAPSLDGDWQQVTHIEVPRIGLRADVVFAPLIHEGVDTTWAVPAFRVGHAQYTAGAGGVGNVVLIGHVSSLDAGSVFHDLHLIRNGDAILITSRAATYRYVVSYSEIVSRSDVSVASWTPNRALTLITCAGAWVPAIDDYATRLVVRAVAE
jgi:LPXTG-site transpeptidase (sortase) family protein